MSFYKAKLVKGVWSLLLIFLLALFMIPSLSYSFDDRDEIWKELELVQRLYDAGAYDKAWKKVRALRKRIKMDDPPYYGEDYSGAVRRAIRYWENKIKDKWGYYNDYPKFTGVIVEMEGNYAGYFVVQSGKERKDFLYDGGIVIVGDDSRFKGKKVSWYY